MFILGLAVVAVALVGMVTVGLAEGNRANKFPGLFALGGINLLTSSFVTLDFLFYLLVLSGPLSKGAFCKWIRVCVEQASLFLFLLLICLYFVLQRRKQFHLSTPGAAGGCFNSVMFLVLHLLCLWEGSTRGS